MNNKRSLKIFRANYQLYLMLLPALMILIIFRYIPIYGVQIAFKRYNPATGIWNSPWIGFDHFQRFFNSFQFWTLIRNTFLLKIYAILWMTPFPILIAIIINETPFARFKKFVQTIIFAPHFISVVVMVGIVFLFTNESKGIINHFLEAAGLRRIPFMIKSEWFRTVFITSNVWQNAGWNAIIYIAALAGIDVELHEAAVIDGAGRIQRIWHIDLPSIIPTFVILTLLNLGHMLAVDFEKVYLMQTALNLSVSEVIGTYTFKMGLENAQFSFAAAVGLFTNVINLVLLTIFNSTAKRTNQASLW